MQQKTTHSQMTLAVIISLVSILGIIALALMVLKTGKDAGQGYDAATNIFNAILPVVSAWIGAIIAYYFGSRQINAMQQQQADWNETIGKRMEDQIQTLRQINTGN